MSDLGVLALDPPASSAGTPIGLDDWRLVVEIAVPDSATSVYGGGQYGIAAWTGLEWLDVTARVRGLEWTRGSDEPYGRPRIGELVVTFDNRDGLLSPWTTSAAVATSSLFTPGLPIRVGCVSATSAVGDGWLPQITCVIDEWAETRVSRDADRLVEARCFETMRDLAGIDDLATGSVVGYGEDAADRTLRLLDAAGWQWGTNAIDALTILDRLADDYPTGLQSTDMAANRLAELYQTADSNGLIVRTERTGRVLLYWPRLAYLNASGWRTVDRSQWPLVDHSARTLASGVEIPAIGFDVSGYRVGAYSTWDGVLVVPYDAGSLAVTVTDEHVVNDVQLGKVGGTAVPYTNPESIGKHGRRATRRTDMLYADDAAGALTYTALYEPRSRTALIVDAIEVATSDRGDDTYLGMIAVDIGVPCFVRPPDSGSFASSPDAPILYGTVAAVTHRVTPRKDGATWTSTVRVDPDEYAGALGHTVG